MLFQLGESMAQFSQDGSEIYYVCFILPEGSEFMVYGLQAQPMLLNNKIQEVFYNGLNRRITSLTNWQ